MLKDMESQTIQSCLSNEEQCPICHDKGWVFYEDDNGYLFQKPCECGCLERMKMASRLRFANLPSQFADYRLKDLEKDVYEDKHTFITACKGIKTWLDNYEKMRERGKGLYLYSSTKGSGKTRVAVSIANELMQTKNVPVKFATSVDIISEIKQTWEHKDDEHMSESKLLDALVTTEVLIIDDFGTEAVKDWTSEKFYSIINGRYVGKKVTIFTSNMNLDNLKYDSRITNRIKEMAYFIPFPEESVRDRIAENMKSELWGKNNG